MEGYNKDFLKTKLLLSNFGRLNNQNGEKNIMIIQDNENKSDSSSFCLVLLQSAQMINML